MPREGLHPRQGFGSQPEEQCVPRGPDLRFCRTGIAAPDEVFHEGLLVDFATFQAVEDLRL